MAIKGLVDTVTGGAIDPDGRYVQEGDSRLSNARTPTAHAASHATGGDDPLPTFSLYTLLGQTNYIAGADIIYLSDTSATVTPGAVVTESGVYLSWDASLSVDLSTVVATSANIYLYAYDSGSGVVAIHATTTAPSSPYLGTARSLPTDTGYRFIGFVRCLTTSAAVWRWNWINLSDKRYRIELIGASYFDNGFRLTAQPNGYTSFDISGLVPATADELYILGKIAGADFDTQLGISANNYQNTYQPFLVRLNGKTDFWGSLFLPAMWIPLSIERNLIIYNIEVGGDSSGIAEIVGYGGVR